MDAPMRERAAYRFGPYTLDPMKRTLHAQDTVVVLPARLFDTLLCLVEAQGRTLRHEDLERALWPGRTMDHNNVGQAISSLRRALQPTAGAEPIIVTTRQGYRLALPVHVGPSTPPGTASPAAIPGPAFHAAPDETRLRIPVRLTALSAGIALLCAGLLVFWAWHPRGLPAMATPPHTVAVLAFDNFTGDPRQDYFSDGLSEELIDSLGGLDGVRVAARRSAFSFKGKAATVADIARQLHVASVVEGSVRQDGAKLRIDVRLIDAATGFEVWSHRYDRDRGAALEVQSDVAKSVARGLRVTLGTRNRDPDQGGTANPDALDWYLRGLKLVHDGGGVGMPAAIKDFDAALQLDPNFAWAAMQRAAARAIVSQVQDTVDLDSVRSLQNQAMADARRAVALAPELGLAHAILGRLLWEIDLDFPLAAREIDQARELSPGDAQVLSESAVLQFELGNAEAGIEAASEAVALDPLSAEATRKLAGMLSDAGRFPEAVIALHHAEQIAGPAALETMDLESDIALARGDFAAGRGLCAAARDWQQLTCLAIADRKLGRPQDADADLVRLHTMLGDTGALQYAEIAAQAGDMPTAATWLATAFRLRDPGLADLRADPLLRPLRGAPNFAEVERAVFGTTPTR